MALIRGGSPLGELSGKMGGLVFARNKGGAYVRQYVAPVNPNTVAQVNARAAFASSVTNFHSLNPTEKALWQDYAQNIFSPLNQPNMGQYSGINAFTSLLNVVNNANSKAIGAGDWDVEVDMSGTPIGINTDSYYTLNLQQPPAAFNTGLLVGGNATPSQVNLQLVPTDAFITEILNFGMTFNLNPVSASQNFAMPQTTSFSIGATENTNFVPVGFAFYMSESVAQDGDFIVNPYKYHLGTTLPVTEWDSPISGNSITIRATPQLNLDNYQAIPIVGSVVRLTAVMVDLYGQRKMIGSLSTSVSSSTT